MPKGIDIKDKFFFQIFKQQVVDSLPFSLDVNKNFQLFSDLILSKTRLQVSVSTLKRLFLKKGDILPTRYTLDAICLCIGFKDWNSFVEHFFQQIEYEHFEFIKSIKHEGYLNKERFNSIYSKFEGSEFEYDITLTLIERAIQQRDIDVLKDIFLLPIFENVDPNIRPHYYFLELFGYLFRNNDIIYELIPYWANDENCQTAYCERFVDEDNLNGYFSVVLEEYHKYKNTIEAQLFYHSLLCQRDLQNGIYESEHYQHLLLFKETKPVHTTPKMRRLALLIVYYNHKGIDTTQLIREITTILPEDDEYVRLFNAYTFCHLVFYANDYITIKQMLIELNLDSNKLYQNILTNRYLNMIKLYEAYVFCMEGELEKARRRINSIDFLYFSPYNINAYRKQYEIVKTLIDNKITQSISV